MLPEWFLQAVAIGDIDPRALAIDRDWLRALCAGRREAAIHPATERAVARRAGAVAVLPVRGIITAKRGWLEVAGLATSTQTIGRNLAAAVADPEVKAVVLDVDSPGGGVSGVTELHAEIMRQRGNKPIVAHADYLAASAAYWIATAADEIVASPSALVGSVGVFSMHIDFSQALEADGVKVTFIAEPPGKVDGNPFEPLSESGRQEIETIVDEAYRAFVSDIARGRAVPPATVRDEYGGGHVLTASDAQKVGMVDKVRTMDATLAAYGVAAEPPPRRGSAARRRLEVDLIAS